MSHPDDGQLHALVDGELSPADAAAIELHARTCEPCRARLDEARMLLGESDRIVARLDLEPRYAPAARGARNGFDHRVLGLAASALLVVTVGYLAVRPGRTAPARPLDSVSREAEAAAPAPSAAAPAPPTSLLKDSAPREEKQAAKEQEDVTSAPGASDQLASRAQAAQQRAASDTPPARAADGVALNDLPPWKAKVAAPSAPPASARFRLEGLDVVSSQALPEGGIRLIYSVNGTPVEFDQVRTPVTATKPSPTAGGMHELTWPRDDHQLTLRSTLPPEELERLRQLVR
jgi:hypothetical protein